MGLQYLCSENKGADQLRGSNRAADLRLCFCICKKKQVFLGPGSNVGQIAFKELVLCLLEIYCYFHEYLFQTKAVNCTCCREIEDM